MKREDRIKAAMKRIQELKTLIKPLGFLNKRSLALKRMSQEWLEKDWTKVKDLYGCGQYAQDSDSIFYLGNTSLEPKDGELARYLEFARKEL